MGSPFKMKPQSPMMKALVGKQGNLPQHLQDKIKAAPETAKKGSPAKSYGSKTQSPVMQKDTKGKKKFGEASDETREKQSIGKRDIQRGSGGQRKGKIGGTTVKAKIGKERGATDLLEVAKDTYKAGKKYVKGKLGIPKMEDNSPVKKRKISEKAAKRKASKGKGMISRKYGGKSQDSEFVKFTRKGRKQAKKTGMVSSTEFKKATPIKKKGVKALEAQRGTKNASPIKKYGSKKSPVMQQDLKKKAQRAVYGSAVIGASVKGKKKDTKGKTKLPKLVVNTPKGPKAPRGPQGGSIRGVNVSIQTKGRSTKNTDLLEVGKKYYKKAKKYVKSKMN